MAQFTGTLPASTSFSAAVLKEVDQLDASVDQLELVVDSMYREFAAKGHAGQNKSGMGGRTDAARLLTLKKLAELGIFEDAVKAGLIGGSAIVPKPSNVPAPLFSDERPAFEAMNLTEVAAFLLAGAAAGYGIKYLMDKKK